MINYKEGLILSSVAFIISFIIEFIYILLFHKTSILFPCLFVFMVLIVISLINLIIEPKEVKDV